MSLLDLVRSKRVVLAAGRLPLPTVADHVAGDSVRGDWWSHPKSEAIRGALRELDREPEVRTCTLVGARVTFVHASIWPAVIRLAGDPDRMRAAIRKLPAVARRLIDAVESAGSPGLRIDAVPSAPRSARRHLEIASLVQSGYVHGGSGDHAAVLRAWDHVGTARERRGAARLSLEEAADIVAEALVHAAGPVASKELRRWIPLSAKEVDFSITRLLRTGRIRREGGLLSPSSGTG